MSRIVPNVEEFVSEDHRYRKLLKLGDWVELSLFALFVFHRIMENKCLARDE